MMKYNEMTFNQLARIIKISVSEGNSLGNQKISAEHVEHVEIGVADSQIVPNLLQLAIEIALEVSPLARVLVLVSRAVVLARADSDSSTE